MSEDYPLVDPLVAELEMLLIQEFALHITNEMELRE